MMPHTLKLLPLPPPVYFWVKPIRSTLAGSSSEITESPAFLNPRFRGRSTELSPDESDHPSTKRRSLRSLLVLAEHPHGRHRARGPDEHAAPAVELRVEPSRLREHACRQLPHAHGDVLLGLRPARHLRRRLGEGAAVQGPAEQQRSDETVAGDVALEVDHVAGLLAAEDAPLAPERFEHVAVADVRGDD